jgi:uncharacterized Zn-binding protein involved in type VI secretion
MSDTARIFFDGKGVDAPAGSTVISALESVSVETTAAVRAGERVITDSRGLPVEAETVIYNGAIFRVIRVRARDAEEHSEI